MIVRIFQGFLMILIIAAVTQGMNLHTEYSSAHNTSKARFKIGRNHTRIVICKVVTANVRKNREIFYSCE